MLEALPPLGSLHAFVLVAQTGSLSGAATRLNVTQPAVSKRIRMLEAHLHTALVSRGSNALSLTPAGHRYAAALLGALSDICTATMALESDPIGPLRVSAYTTLALRWLIPRLPRFKARHPGCEVAVTASLEPIDFSEGQVDASIRMSTTPPTSNAERLLPVTLAPFVAPTRNRRRRGLDGLTLLGSKVQPDYWALWSAASGVALPGKPLLFESTSMAVQAAIEGLGAVIVPPAFVAPERRQRRLQMADPHEVPTGEHYWLLLPPGRLRPELLAFRDWLLEEGAT
jgi:LysR family glycine cleavage system transcriptional activator